MNKENDCENEDKKSSSEIAKLSNTSLEKIDKQVNDYIKGNNYNNEDFIINSIRDRRALVQAAKKDFSPFSGVPVKVFDVVEGIISHYSKDLFDEEEELDAKEEDISAALSVKITDSLVGSMESALDGRIIGDYKFKMITQKKQTQEAFTGADLVGVCTIIQEKQKINKFFLLQAKIGVRRSDGSVIAKNSRIQTQAEKMIKTSPSSFFIIYTKQGFEVVSAMNVLATGKNEIDTRVIKSKPYEEFNNLLLDCFSGDNRFDRQEWKDYINDPKKNPIPFEESLLHLIIKNQKKK